MQTAVKNNHSEAFIAFLLPFILGIVIFRMDALQQSVRDTLALCARALIPTIFPFLIISDLLLRCSATRRVLFLCGRPFARLLKVSPHGASAFLIGAVFGFPMGAKAIVSYYRDGLVEKEEGERLLLYAGNASPFFLIGSVGGILFSSRALGVYLFLLQTLISFLCGVLLSIGKKRETPLYFTREEEASDFSLTRSVKNAVTQSLYICGYMLFFSAILSVFLPLVKNAFLARLLAAFLEISTACALASENIDSLSLAFAAFSISFSGLSVLFQTKDCIEGTNLSLKGYLPVKLACGTAAFLLSRVFFP